QGGDDHAHRPAAARTTPERAEHSTARRRTPAGQRSAPRLRHEPEAADRLARRREAFGLAAPAASYGRGARPLVSRMGRAVRANGDRRCRGHRDRDEHHAIKLAISLALGRMVAPMATAQTSPERLTSYNPATGDAIGSVPIFSPGDVDAAVARARV